MSTIKEASERLRSKVKELTESTHGTRKSIRETFKDARGDRGPVRSFLEERKTLLLNEPLIKKLRRR